MLLFFLLLLLVLAWEFPVVALVLFTIALIMCLVISIIESRGAILLIIPAAGLVWLAYKGTYLWYSPNSWPTVTTIAVIAATIGVIAFLCWFSDKKPTLAVTIGVILVVAACVAFGIYWAIQDMTPFGGGVR